VGLPYAQPETLIYHVHTETFLLWPPAGNQLRKTNSWTAGEESSGERTTERRQQAGEAADAQPHVSRSRNQTPPAAVQTTQAQEHNCKVTMSTWSLPWATRGKCLIKHCAGVRAASKHRAVSTHHFLRCYRTDGCVPTCIAKEDDHQGAWV